MGGGGYNVSSTIVGAIVKGDENSVTNNTDINGGFVAVIKGDGNTVVNTGDVYGIMGIASKGNGNALINTGNIYGALGITSSGMSNELLNTGTVISALGMSSVGDSNSIINEGTLITLGLPLIGDIELPESMGSNLLKGYSIYSEGVGNSVINNGTLVNLSLLTDTSAGIKFINEAVTKSSASIGAVTNNSFIVGVGLDFVDGNIVLGKTVGIDTEGDHVNISNNLDLINGGIGIIVVTGSSIGINSDGSGSVENLAKIHNNGIILNIGLNLENIGDLLESPDLNLDTLLGLIGGDGAGIGINSKGDYKDITNTFTVAGRGIVSEGDNNKITNKGVALGSLIQDIIGAVGGDIGELLEGMNFGITAVEDGVLSIGANNIIDNQGKIVAKNAIVSEGDGNIITNSRHGSGIPLVDPFSQASIEAKEVGIKSTGNNNTIDNQGKITALEVGILSTTVDSQVNEVRLYNNIIKNTGTGVGTQIGSLIKPTPTQAVIQAITGIKSIGNVNYVENQGKIIAQTGIESLGDYNVISNTAFVLDGKNLTAEIDSSSVAIKSEGDYNTIKNSGNLKALNLGIEAIGNYNEVSNTKNILSEGIGIAFLGFKTDIKNSGTITSDFIGVYVVGNETTINNSGDISSELLGIGLLGDDGDILNTGNIELVADGGVVGVELIGLNNQFINKGNISIKTLDLSKDFGYSVGIRVGGSGAFALNEGNIKVTGYGIGMEALDGATVKNKGTIILNDKGSLAMSTDENELSWAINNGTIIANFVPEEPTYLDEFFSGNYNDYGVIKDSNGNIIGYAGESIVEIYKDKIDLDTDYNRYVITGNGSLDREGVVSTARTVILDGTELVGTLNVTSEFNRDDYLVIADNAEKSALVITGTINAADKGLYITDSSEVLLSGGTINAYDIAVGMRENSTFTSENGYITGNITIAEPITPSPVVDDPTVTLKESFLSGNIDFHEALGASYITILNSAITANSINGAKGDVITGAGADEITIQHSLIEGSIMVGDGENKVVLNSSEIYGDILGGHDNDMFTIENSIINGIVSLGNGDDYLTLDSSTINFSTEETVLNGGIGYDTLNMNGQGVSITKNLLISFQTTFSGTIDEFEKVNFKDKVIFTNSVRIDGATTTHLNLSERDTALLLEIEEREAGQYLTLQGSANKVIEGDGTLYIDATDIVNKGLISADITLESTTVNLNKNQVQAAQFIYDLSWETTQLLLPDPDFVIHLSIKTAEAMGMSPGLEDIIESITSSQTWSNVYNTITYGTESDLENLLFKTKYRNVYSLGNKLAYDSMNLYQLGTEKFTAVPKADQWLVQAEGIGRHEDANSPDTTFMTAGALVAGEYGVTSNTSIGLSFGAGKQNAKYTSTDAKLEGDTFYFGAYGKMAYENFRFLVGGGYQHNKYSSTNKINNAYDYFSNSDKFNNNGANIFAEAKYIYDFKADMRLEPRLATSYNYLNQDSINEGNNPWAISVDSVSQSLVNFDIGIDFVKEIQNSGTKGELKLTFNQKFTTGDNNKKLSASFNGVGRSYFAVDGYDIGNARTTVGVGASFEKENGLFYDLSYGYEFGSSTSTNKVVLGLGYKF